MWGFLLLAVRISALPSFKNLSVWEKQATAVSTHGVGNSNKKGLQELRNLVSTINYDGHSARNTRGSVKSSGLGTAVCP